MDVDCTEGAKVEASGALGVFVLGARKGAVAMRLKRRISVME